MKKKSKQFASYCWGFYGPNKVHGDFFGHSLTREELEAAVSIQVAEPSFEGDSVDSERMIETR
jgi:hypothetical protein